MFNIGCKDGGLWVCSNKSLMCLALQSTGVGAVGRFQACFSVEEEYMSFMKNVY